MQLATFLKNTLTSAKAACKDALHTPSILKTEESLQKHWCRSARWSLGHQQDSCWTAGYCSLECTTDWQDQPASVPWLLWGLCKAAV